MSKQRLGEVTALGGRLVWWGCNKWAWSDGKPAPQVRDITPSWFYNFRCRGLRPAQEIEVPVKLAESEPELAWVLAGAYPRDLSGDHGSTLTIHMDGRRTRTSDSGKALPEVILVPAAEWDQWDATFIIGPKWDKADEDAVFAHARALGWESPR